jgi:DNA-binding HxlR family transcriptional regulator
MLTQTLRRMEAQGLIERDVLDRVPPHVEYSLTPLGRTLEKPLVAICEWAMEHLDELRDARAVYAGAGGR